MPGSILQSPLLKASGGEFGVIRYVALPVDDPRSDQSAVAFIAYVQRVRICKENSKWKHHWMPGRAVLRNTACKRRGKTRQYRERSGLNVRRSWQHAGISHLVHCVDSVAAAALRDVHRIVENGQPAEIVILPRFVRSSVADLRHFEVADHIDAWRYRRCLSGYQKFSSRGVNQVQSDLCFGELRL